jgi:predicted transcriptional regulator
VVNTSKKTRTLAIAKSERRGERRTHPLEAMRRAAGVSASNLAERTGLALSTISRIEHGHEKARPATLRLVELALKPGSMARR